MVIEGFKGRTVSLGDKVRVYRNLNNGKWSIKAMTGEYKGKVVAHLDYLTLKDTSFIVSMAGRARVLREGRKNVHAFAMGFLHSCNEIELESTSEVITYDPYRCGFFYSIDSSNTPIETIKQLNFTKGKAFV